MRQIDDKQTIKEDIKVIAYVVKIVNKFSKSFMPIALASSIFKALAPFINIIMPKYIIDELMGEKRIKMFIILISITIFANFILSIINSGFDRLIDFKIDKIQKLFDLEVSKKTANMDYSHVENPEVLDTKERAVQGMKESGGITTLTNNIKDIISKILTIAGLTYVLFLLSPWVIILILLVVIINSIIEKNRQNKSFIYWGKNAENNKMYRYFKNEVIYDYNAGKYVRLYHIIPLIMDRWRRSDRNSFNLFQKVGKTGFHYNSISIVLNQIEMIVIYVFLVFKVIYDPLKFTIGSFMMCASATTTFALSVTDILTLFIRMRFACKYTRVYEDFLELPDIMPKNDRKIENRLSHEIEFKNVSFKYPGADNYVLKNISFKIPVGKRLAVVGMNGAGKTTFIKLLMRLYDPDQGEILLDGIDIKEYDYKEYLDLFSVVFQDFKLLAFSIKENISLENSDTADDTGIIKVLQEAGLGERINTLERGIDTSIYKRFDEKGIEFSGGENQKLAIARALYKNAPIVVLDEPTAALDPISEYDIYSKFDTLVGGKTAIFISHRLSSCRFCDSIAVFDGGEIIEYGKHDELLKKRDGKYTKLWNAQAQYYV